MTKKRIQNSIGESRMLLPAIAVYCCIVWFLAGAVQHLWWQQFLCFALSSYLMIEINNQNAFLRVYSRLMVSCFAILTLMTGLMPLRGVFFTQLCFIIFLYILFRCYQNNDCPGTLFFAYAILAMGTIPFVQLFYLVPMLMLLMLFNVQAGGLRNIVASFTGLLLPYFYWAVYILLTRGDISGFLTHFEQLAVFDISQIANLNVVQWATFGFISAYFIISYIHFERYTYQDKVKTKMLFYSFLWIDIALAVMIVLLPEHYNYLILLLIVGTSGPMAHLTLFTHNRLSTVLFFVSLAIILTFTVYHLWML